MLIPALDFKTMLQAQDFPTSKFPVAFKPGDFYVGPTEAVPQFGLTPPAVLANERAPKDAFFIDSGTAFSPTRFMGQSSEIRYARILIHLRASEYKKGRIAMMEVMNFLLGKKFYVHPGMDDINFSDRVVWHRLDAANVLNPDNTIKYKRKIVTGDPTLLEYLDVYTTTSDPIHSGPSRNDLHTYTATYNMVYTQSSDLRIGSGQAGQVITSGVEGTGRTI